MRVLGSELLQKSIGLVSIGSGQSADQGDLKVDELSSLDDAVGDGVALHNASEDVDQDGLHLGMGRKDLEGSLHLLNVGTPSDIEEVGRLSAF